MERLTIEEGREILPSQFFDNKYELLDRVTRMAHTADDWGDEATVGLFVSARNKEPERIEEGPHDSFQWAGFHDVDGGLKPCLLLRRTGGFDDPVEVPGEKPLSADGAGDYIIAMTFGDLEDTFENRRLLRSLCCRFPIAGAIVCENLAEMQMLFCLD